MVRKFESEPVTAENFDEVSYLLANPDVAKAVAKRTFATGREHFDRYGRAERRVQFGSPAPFTDYESRPPSADTMLDLFGPRWSSAIPGHGRGASTLFEDGRIAWFISQMGGVAGRRILELGPLEAGHTTMLARAGADVTAIEGNKGAFLRCLIVKELFDIKARFLLGDFVPYIAAASERFDAVVASGVLYHMREPVEIIEHLGRMSDAILIWTHYFEDAPLRAHKLRHKFPDAPVRREYRGGTIELWEQNYLDALDHSFFCGGPAQTSTWLSRQSLFDVIERQGFDITVGGEARDHANGPSILLLARRRA